MTLTFAASDLELLLQVTRSLNDCSFSLSDEAQSRLPATWSTLVHHLQSTHEEDVMRECFATGKDRDLESLLERTLGAASGERARLGRGGTEPQGALTDETLSLGGREAQPGEVSAETILKAFALAFDFPERRLACYGSLRPGRKNFHEVSDISGSWTEGTVRGFVWKWNGYPIFASDLEGPEIVVSILQSDSLPLEYPRLDEFEGADYRRALVPVQSGDSLTICNIYESVAS